MHQWEELRNASTNTATDRLNKVCSLLLERSGFSARNHVHQVNIGRLIAVENGHIDCQLSKLQKALKPWLLANEPIKLRLDLTANQLNICNNTIKYLVEHKVNQKVEYLALESMKSIFFHVFSVFNQVKSLALEYGGVDCTDILCGAVTTVQKLRHVEYYSTKSLCEHDVANIDSSKLLTLRALKAFHVLESHQNPEALTNFLSLLPNVTILEICDKIPHHKFIEECKNSTNLRSLEIKKHYVDMPILPTKFSDRGFPALLHLAIDCAKLLWHELAFACPRLLNLKLVASEVVFGVDLRHRLHLNTLYLDRVGLRNVDHQVSCVRQTTDTTLRHLIVLGYLAVAEVKQWIVDPTPLVNCRVSFRGKLFGQSASAKRIQVYLCKLLVIIIF